MRENPGKLELSRLVARSGWWPLLLMIALAGALGAEILVLLRVSAWVDHTDVVISRAETLDADMADLQGSLLVAEPDVREPFERALGEVENALDALTTLVADNPGQLASLTRVRRQLLPWLSTARALESSRPEDRPALHRAERVRMKGIRGEIDAFLVTERALRSGRTQQAQEAAGLILLGSVALTLVFGLVLAWLARRQVRRVSHLFRNTVEELERALTLRDEFLAVAAHELRTPVAALKLRVQALLRSARRAAVAAEWVEKLSAVEGQSSRLAALVDRLLDVARMREGHMELEVAELDLGALVRGVVERMAAAAAEVGSRIEVATEPDLRWHGDEVRLETAVTNLVSNALKYGRGHPIDVQAGRELDGWVRVTVRDRGIGIAPGDHVRIFDRYARAVKETHYPGLGIGLWLVREIAEAHGGNVNVHSATGNGSTFVLRLPPRLPTGAPERLERGPELPDAVG